MKTALSISGKVDLKGRVAVVVGAARGIGRECARVLAREGATVAVCDIISLVDVLEDLTSMHAKNHGSIVNIADSGAVDAFVHEVVERFGRVDILVVCAGICPPRKAIQEVSNEEWDQVMAVNVAGPFYFIRAVYPHMAKQRYGKIVCFGSSAGKNGGIMAGPQYTASKGAVHALTKWVAISAGKDGINVNAICPGAIDTDMIRGVLSYENAKKAIPLGRIGVPQDIAEAVLFLSSDASNYLSGVLLDVNGGLYMS